MSLALEKSNSIPSKLNLNTIKNKIKRPKAEYIVDNKKLI